MGKKQKKKATRSKEMSQKTCIAEIEEDESGSDWGSCDNLLCANNGEDSENYAMDLEEVIKDQQRIFNEKESASKDLISRLKRMFDDVSNRSKGLEADLEKSNKQNEELEAEIISLKEDLNKTNKKNAGLEEEIISLKEILKRRRRRMKKSYKILKNKEKG